ncbi:MAG TPA: DUF1684 domain-containing protein [Candidatus Limnocylindrales bacterium]|nr:DUF1684 domain-containing protein [Candidatus Limnocylindrales bacterium]
MDLLDLADWRERVASLYLSDLDLTGFRRARDELFATHPQSPVRGNASFTGLSYFDPDPAFAVEAGLTAAEGEIQIDTGDTDGVVTYRRVTVAHTGFGPLTLWWIEAYGGGLFLPFRDETHHSHTYGGGRYLTDTVKGTFGRGVQLLDGDRIRLDFNYAYNPSCAYSDEYVCPLAPRENWLEVPIRAGEMKYRD